MCSVLSSAMEIENVLTFVGMIIVQLAQVGATIAGKIAMANGMTTFTVAFYSNAMASLILLPISIAIYGSSSPPLLFTFLSGFFLLGFIGFLVQIFGYTGVKYASASLCTSMLNLIPGFTFLLAVILRMEKFELRNLSTVAKTIGTILSIVGALVLTLYRGTLVMGGGPSPPPSSYSPHANSSPAWFFGGFILAIDSIFSSFFIIAQAFVLKKCPKQLLLMFFYSCFVAIMSASAALFVERDYSAWNLKPKTKLIPVIYTGLFGNVFQVSIIMWCLKRKGPLFASIFHPLGIIFATVMGIIFLGEPLYFGSILGSIVVLIGFYSVVWGRAKEDNEAIDGDVSKSFESNDNRAPLLQSIEEGR